MNKKLSAVIFFLSVVVLFSFQPINKRSFDRRNFDKPVGTVYIIVDKSDYQLQVYDDKGWYATYPVVFGSKSKEDKMTEGDRRTPEGTFKIIYKKPHSKWHKMLMLDYPTQESIEKFNKRKEEGLIPKNARIGGGIGIHGTWPNDNIVVDDYTNWTMGCVSMRNADLDEISEFTGPGTKVIIRR